MKIKNVIVILALCATGTFIINGCNKDDDKDAEIVDPSAPVMTAKIDGVSWTAFSHRVEGWIFTNKLNLSGAASDSSDIIITLTETIVSGGTYNLGVNSSNAGVLYPKSGSNSPAAWTSNSHPSSTGMLQITSMDTVNQKMNGTFSFKAWRFFDNTFREVTDGQFSNIPYTIYPSGGGTNLFTIKVNNVRYTPDVISQSHLGTQLIIGGSDSLDDQSAAILIPDNILPGTYTFSRTPSGLCGTYCGVYSNINGGNSSSTYGTLVITEHNTTTKKITGICSFYSQDFWNGPDYELTNGDFSVTYQ